MIIVWLWNSYSCYEDADACNLFYTFYVEWVVSAAWDQWWRQEPTMFLRLFGETRLPGVLLKFSNKRSHFCVLLGLWLPMLTCEPTTSSSSCPSPSPTGPCHLPLSRSESETSCQWLGWTSLCGGLTTAGQPQVHIWGRLWASLMFRCASLDWSTTSGVLKSSTSSIPSHYSFIGRSLRLLLHWHLFSSNLEHDIDLCNLFLQISSLVFALLFSHQLCWLEYSFTMWPAHLATKFECDQLILTFSLT